MNILLSYRLKIKLSEQWTSYRNALFSAARQVFFCRIIDPTGFWAGLINSDRWTINSDKLVNWHVLPAGSEVFLKCEKENLRAW
jgi:hypothetical protein